MNGHAPKLSLTGSQSWPKKNLMPNLWSESCDLEISSQTTSTTMAKTEIALRMMRNRKKASGRRLLAGRESLIFDRTERGIFACRSVSTLASVGIEVIGFDSSPKGFGGFIGSTLSDICYKFVNAPLAVATGL